MKGLSKDRKKILKKCLTNYQLYLMILPAFIFIILFEYLPMYGVQIAFRDFNFKDGIVNSAWVGLENFKRLFNSYWFPIIFKNTITLSGLRLLVGFPMPIIFALMVNEIGHGKVKKWIQTVSYAPHFISTVVMCGMIILLLTPETGLFNLIIQAFGGESISFMQNPKLFKWIHVLSGVWQGTGWSAIIYFAALSGVDQGLLEAAQIDGANRLQRIRYINLPVLVPTIMIQLILSMGSILSVGYQKILLLQNTMNLNASEVISTYVYKVGLQSYQYSFSTSANLFNSLVNCMMLITVNYIVKKMTKTSLF